MAQWHQDKPDSARELGGGGQGDGREAAAVGGHHQPEVQHRARPGEGESGEARQLGASQEGLGQGAGHRQRRRHR